METKVGWKTLASSGLYCPVACELYSISMCSNGTKCDAAIYDGDSAGGKLITYMRAPAAQQKDIIFNEPIRCNSGIYATLSANVASLLIQFRRIG